MAGFNRRVWRAKPPMGTPLASGLLAPDLIAIPFNEISITGGFWNYAVAARAPAPMAAANGPSIVQGPNGPRVSLTNSTP